MKEVVYSFEEFKEKVNPMKPIHHSLWHRNLDKYGTIHDVKMHIYGISKDDDWLIVIFEHHVEFDAVSGNKKLSEKLKEVYDKLYEKYAKPLGSTEGRWEP